MVHREGPRSTVARQVPVDGVGIFPRSGSVLTAMRRPRLRVSLCVERVSSENEVIIIHSQGDPWALAAGDYPAEGTLEQRLTFLLGYAVLAPSGRNTQPWLFRVAEDKIFLYADRTRALPVIDPDDRELVMSCGAALFQLRLALRRFSFSERIELLPDHDDENLLACIQVTEGYDPSAEERRLFEAIPRRHINRMRFEDRDIPASLVDSLREAARAEGCWLHTIDGEDARAAVADLIGAADRIQGSDPDFRREHATFVHFNRSRAEDGMPGYVYGLGDVASAFGPLLMRSFDWGEGQSAKDRELAEGSPVLALLGSDADDLRSRLVAGQALARVLLHACAEDVSVSFLNQPIQRPALRQRLAEILDLEGFPQIILRMGYGPEARPTPRRPVRDVLRETD